MKKRLLIIDDEENLLKSLKEALRFDYDILCAKSGEEAWERIFYDGEGIDLIITDIVLPGMSGLEFLKMAREINPWIPAIAITGLSNHERAAEAANLHLYGYIQKPFDIARLQSKIEELFKDEERYSYVSLAPGCFLGKDPLRFNPLTRQALSEIHRKFHADITLADVAVTLGVCERHMTRVFKNDCGLSPGSYILKLRIEVAKKLLQKTQYPIAKIMEFIGFKDNSYFYVLFRRLTGATPEEFRIITQHVAKVSASPAVFLP